MIRRLIATFIFAAVPLVVLAPLGSASAIGMRVSPTCSANLSPGQSSIGSAVDGQYLEVCLQRTSSNTNDLPARSLPSTNGSASKPLCTSTNVTIHLGPPTFQVKSYKQVICRGAQTTISVKNASPVSKPPASTGQTNSTVTANQDPAQSLAVSSQGAAKFQPENLGVSPSRATLVVGTRLTLRSLAAIHYRTGTILGQPVSVRFVPVEFAWTVKGPGTPVAIEPRQTVDLGFFTVGVFRVESEVVFASEYQPTGSNSWQRAQGLIRTTASADITVEPELQNVVRSSPPRIAPTTGPLRFPRLAASDCRSNPFGRGCSK